MSSPTELVRHALSTNARRRVVASLTGLAIAAGTLLSPQLTSAAAAATAAPKMTASVLARYESNMIAVLNAERKAHHEKPVRMNKKLVLSAHRHNLTMAHKNSMSHQLPGEAFFATRISRAGYNWQAAGENIGWNSAETTTGLQTLEKQMYGEKAPNNGHRLNILSKSFRQVGINVYFDRAHHKMWFTQDFGQPAA